MTFDRICTQQPSNRVIVSCPATIWILGRLTTVYQEHLRPFHGLEKDFPSQSFTQKASTRCPFNPIPLQDARLECRALVLPGTFEGKTKIRTTIPQHCRYVNSKQRRREMEGALFAHTSPCRRRRLVWAGELNCLQ